MDPIDAVRDAIEQCRGSSETPGTSQQYGQAAADLALAMRASVAEAGETSPTFLLVGRGS